MKRRCYLNSLYGVQSTLISLDAIEKSFDDFQVLDGVSFSVEEGEHLSLIGPGGSGKSLILKILLGLMKPDHGDAYLLGKNMVYANELEKQELLRDVGMAFQQGALFDFMTVKENLEFAMRYMRDAEKVSSEEQGRRIKSLLTEIKLSHTEDMYPYELSGGMQRRVGIARALAVEPKLAIFDEPTSGLDPVTSTISLNMIKNLTSENEKVTLLVATTSVEVAMRFARRVVMVNEGKVVADGDWKVLITEGDDWVRNFLSVRLIGLDRAYVEGLGVPESFISQHW